MPVLTLDYRHCDRKRPKYIKHIEIEAIAALARQQLVGGGVDAIAFDTLRQIERLKINGIDFALEVSAECEVHELTAPDGFIFRSSGSMFDCSLNGWDGDGKNAPWRELIRELDSIINAGFDPAEEE